MLPQEETLLSQGMTRSQRGVTFRCRTTFPTLQSAGVRALCAAAQCLRQRQRNCAAMKLLYFTEREQRLHWFQFFYCEVNETLLYSSVFCSTYSMNLHSSGVRSVSQDLGNKSRELVLMD